MIRLSLQASDKASDYFQLTCFLLKSALLQTNITGISYKANALICFIQIAIELNDYLLSTLYIRIIAIADLQKDGVRFRNRSWPAVSQSCTSTLVSAILMIFCPYYSPTVHGIFFLYVSQQNRLRKQVFPTLQSPTRIILIISSYVYQERMIMSARMAIGIPVNSGFMCLQQNNKIIYLQNSNFQFVAYFYTLDFQVKLSASINSEQSVYLKYILEQQKIIQNLTKIQQQYIIW